MVSGAIGQDILPKSMQSIKLTLETARIYYVFLYVFKYVGIRLKRYSNEFPYKKQFKDGNVYSRVASSRMSRCAV